MLQYNKFFSLPKQLFEKWCLKIGNYWLKCILSSNYIIEHAILLFNFKLEDI